MHRSLFQLDPPRKPQQDSSALNFPRNVIVSVFNYIPEPGALKRVFSALLSITFARRSGYCVSYQDYQQVFIDQHSLCFVLVCLVQCKCSDQVDPSPISTRLSSKVNLYFIGKFITKVGRWTVDYWAHTVTTICSAQLVWQTRLSRGSPRVRVWSARLVTSAELFSEIRPHKSGIALAHSFLPEVAEIVASDPCLSIKA